jgi:cellulose biosynthesis protein BcsQ
MKVVSLQGIRSGVGVSSAAASVALSLSAGGLRVLLADRHRTQSGLKVLLNIPLFPDDSEKAAETGIWRYSENLSYMDACSFDRFAEEGGAGFPLRLANAFDILLIDAEPALREGRKAGVIAPDLTLTVLVPDANSVVRLESVPRGEKDYFLLNRSEDLAETERDLVLYIQNKLGRALCPRVVPKDSFAEYCFLNRQAVVQGAPFSASAHAFSQIAVWIRAHLTLPRGAQ